MTKFRDSGPPVMQRAAESEARATPRTFPKPSLANTPLKQTAVSNPRLFREVFGFAFASSLGDPTIGYPSWNFGLLSTVAYFGLHVDWTGGFSGGSGLDIWNDPNGSVPGFIQTAHANGTKVVLTIELFDSTSGTPNMCSALERTNVTIQNTVAEIRAKGIDGVNIDYESDNTTCHDPGSPVQSSQSLFTAFVANMRAALPSGSYLSVDTYSGAAGFRDGSGGYLGFFDIGALNNYVDSFFVMAYDMEYANYGSPPLNCPSFCIGPTAPLSTYLFNDSRASSEYRAVVPANKVIMGIPYYGRKECVAVPDPNTIPPNAEGTSVAADGYLDASTENGYPGNTQYVSHRETRDPLSATRWDTFSSTGAGCNREMYWDDTTALGNKYNLIINDHLRGAGIFALNYGGGAPELWSLINLKFGQCSQAAIAVDKTVPQIPGTSINFTGSALCAGTAQFRFWVEAPGATAFTLAQDYSTSPTWTWDSTGKALGTYSFQVDARNQGSTVSLDTYARTTFRLALCVTPTLAADKASPQILGTAITITPTVTCQGTPDYQFWMLPPGGAWTIAQDYGGGSTFRWDTTGVGYGSYYIGIHVRTTGTTVAYESFGSIPYSLTSCISAALSTDKTSPQPTGTRVGLSGGATCGGAPQYRFMIQPPGGAWSVVQDFGAISTYSWNAGGPGGVYRLELDVKSPTAPVSSASPAQLTFNLSSCALSTLTPNPAPPQKPGAAILLTGAATCTGTPQYRFSIQKPGSTASIVQDYSGGASYNWDTNGLPYGVYGLTVDIRNLGATTSSESTATVSFSLQAAACTVPTTTTTVVSPQGLGAGVNITASTTTCPQPVYQYWLLTGTTTWTLVQAYSPNPTLHWVPAGLPAATYEFSVWVRDASRPGIINTSLGSLDAYVTVFYAYAPCASAGISTAPPPTAPAGTTVSFTGTASGCTSPMYEFWVLAPGSSAWKVAQAYSTNAFFNWSTAGPLPAGLYHLGIWVRDASSPGVTATSMGGVDAFAGTPFTLTSTPCTSVTVSTSKPSPVSAGSTLTIAAAAAGCPTAQYAFWIRPAAGSWTQLQAFSSSATFDWNTAGLTAGTYYVSTWARDATSSGTIAGSLGSYDAATSSAFTLTPVLCTSAALSAAPVSPQVAGTPIAFTAGALGCPNPRYEFWMRPATSSTWQMVQAYSISATLNWNSTGASGTIYFSVWAKDATSSTATFDANWTVAYQVTVPSCTSVTIAAQPTTVVHGATAHSVITGTASACTNANPLYEFWMRPATSSTWTMVHAYSASGPYNWDGTAVAPGTYYFSVWAKDAGSPTATFDANATTTVTVT